MERKTEDGKKIWVKMPNSIENIEMMTCTPPKGVGNKDEWNYRCRVRGRDGEWKASELFIDALDGQAISVRNYANSDIIIEFGHNKGKCTLIEGDSILTCY